MIASSALVEVVMYAEIFGLLCRQRTGNGIAQEMRKSDDGRQGRTQLIGHVMDEIDLHLIGRLKRLVAFAQRSLDVLGIADVLERQHGGAVGQRHGHAIQHAAIAPLQLERHLHAVFDRGDSFADRAPGVRLVEQRSAPGFHGFNVRLLAGARRVTASTFWAKAGLNNCARPLLPNTATASARLSSVSRWTRISPSNRRARSRLSVTSSNR